MNIRELTTITFYFNGYIALGLIRYTKTKLKMVYICIKIKYYGKTKYIVHETK